MQYPRLKIFLARGFDIPFAIEANWGDLGVADVDAVSGLPLRTEQWRGPASDASVLILDPSPAGLAPPRRGTGCRASPRDGRPVHVPAGHIERFGSTTAASSPILLSETLRSDQVEPGDRLLGVVFGSGLASSERLLAAV